MPLEDVRDLAAFCDYITDRTLADNGKRITELELVEARAEAVVMALELHGDGWDGERSFAAYLRGVLPNKLISWWRREMRQSGLGNYSGSTSSYIFYGRVSIDDQIKAGHHFDNGQEDMPRHDSALITYGPEG